MTLDSRSQSAKSYILMSIQVGAYLWPANIPSTLTCSDNDHLDPSGGCSGRSVRPVHRGMLRIVRDRHVVLYHQLVFQVITYLLSRFFLDDEE